jgi:hypothetical protein
MRESGEGSAKNNRITGQGHDYPANKRRSPVAPPLSDISKGRNPAAPRLDPAGKTIYEHRTAERERLIAAAIRAVV